MNKILKEPKNLLRAVIRQGNTELGEEFTEAQVIAVVDLFAGEKSVFNAVKQDYISKGFSEEDATAKASFDCFISDPIKSGVYGWFSGVIMGTGAAGGGCVERSQISRHYSRQCHNKGKINNETKNLP